MSASTALVGAGDEPRPRASRSAAAASRSLTRSSPTTTWRSTLDTSDAVDHASGPGSGNARIGGTTSSLGRRGRPSGARAGRAPRHRRRRAGARHDHRRRDRPGHRLDGPGAPGHAPRRRVRPERRVLRVHVRPGGQRRPGRHSGPTGSSWWAATPSAGSPTGTTARSRCWSATGPARWCIEAVDGPGNLLSHNLHSDGSLRHLLYCDHGGYLVDGRPGDLPQGGPGRGRLGRAGACRTPASASTTIAMLVPHQANLRIIQAACHRLGIPEERTAVVIDRYGNTSSASIPLALDDVVQSGRVRDGDLLLLTGFGGGMSWASAVLRWGA